MLRRLTCRLYMEKRQEIDVLIKNVKYLERATFKALKLTMRGVAEF